MLCIPVILQFPLDFIEYRVGNGKILLDILEYIESGDIVLVGLIYSIEEGSQ